VTNTTLVSLGEYLSTTYRPDCDFLEGELLERNMGEQPHARVQLIIASIFENQRKIWNTRTLPEQRVQVWAERYRIPDICVQRRSDPRDLIVRVAPLLCVEIFSSADTKRDIQKRVDDYVGMGVEHVWAVDPWKRVGYYASAEGFREPVDGVLRIEGTPIAVSLTEVFAELDED
jgi:Uma2 family endonuclease